VIALFIPAAGLTRGRGCFLTVSVRRTAPGRDCALTRKARHSADFGSGSPHERRADRPQLHSRVRADFANQ